MCTRILYETGTGTYITGRNVDWTDPSATPKLYAYPRGMKQDGGVGERSLKWTSKYGSVFTALYDVIDTDGFNEKGLAVNMLYLAEADYGDPEKTGKPLISIGAWVQYYLDNFATVEEAVNATRGDDFTVSAPILPNGRAATGHLSLADASGDSAILEYLDGKLTIHHSPEYKVMTNNPPFDQQLAINAYWKLIGGAKFLPGTLSPADRFVRASYMLETSKKYDDREMAVASVFSQMRAIGIPLEVSDPVFNDVGTLWRNVDDHDAKRYYFESAVKPAVFWLDLDKVGLDEGDDVKSLDIIVPETLAGEVSAKFQKSDPMTWIKPTQ